MGVSGDPTDSSEVNESVSEALRISSLVGVTNATAGTPPPAALLFKKFSLSLTLLLSSVDKELNFCSSVAVGTGMVVCCSEVFNKTRSAVASCESPIVTAAVCNTQCCVDVL